MITIPNKRTETEEYKMDCSHCKKTFAERLIQEHHCHPRFMNNKKGVGLKVGLCEKCHNILHFTIPKILWNIMSEDQKEKAIKQVESYSEKYGGIDYDDS